MRFFFYSNVNVIFCEKVYTCHCCGCYNNAIQRILTATCVSIVSLLVKQPINLIQQLHSLYYLQQTLCLILSLLSLNYIHICSMILNRTFLGCPSGFSKQIPVSPMFFLILSFAFPPVSL